MVTLFVRILFLFDFDLHIIYLILQDYMLFDIYILCALELSSNSFSSVSIVLGT